MYLTSISPTPSRTWMRNGVDSNVMVQWCNGAMVQWCNGAMVLHSLGVDHPNPIQSNPIQSNPGRNPGLGLPLGISSSPSPLS